MIYEQEENWYKPAPGEPYRPLIAIPQQLRDIGPWSGNCVELWFTGYDPPRALTPKAAMVPDVTLEDQHRSSTTTMPSNPQDPRFGETTANKAPVPTPAQSQKFVQPEKTTMPSSGSLKQGSNNELNPSSDSQADSGEQSDPDPGHLNSNDQSLGQEGDTSSEPEGGDSGQQASPGSDPQSNTDSKARLGDGVQTDSPDPNGSITGAAVGSAKALIEGRPTTIDGQIIQILTSDNAVSVGGVKITAGAPRITISGTPISLGPSALVVGTNSISIIPSPAIWAVDPVTTFDGQVIQLLSNGNAMSIGGVKITAGAPSIIISGTPISLGPFVLIVGTSSISIIPSPASWAADPVTTVDGQVVQLLSDGNAVSIGGVTITAGAPLTTLSGIPISFGLSALVVGASSIAITHTLAAWASGQVTTIGGQTIQYLSNGDGISIAGTTLGPGVPAITISGTSISLDRSALFVGTDSFRLEAAFLEQTVATVARQATSAVKIADFTLTPGAAGTAISGTRVSLDSAGQLIVGGTFLPDSPSGDLGQLIMQGFGPPSTTASPSHSHNGSSTVFDNSTSGNSTKDSTNAFEGEAKALSIPLVSECMMPLVMISALILLYL